MIDRPSPDELVALYSSAADYEAYVDVQRTDVLDERYTETLERLRQLLGEHESRTLFDVGAGAGAFLLRARDRGFDVSGNEISSPARQMCRERHSIELSELSLEDQPGRERFDVITMWCVLAHVLDAREALEAAMRLLRPGGILYFHTPRWCAIDTFGIAMVRVSGGRLGRVTRRRIGLAHMRLYDESNLTSLLTSVGFEVVTMRPKTAFSLRTGEYLRAIGVPRLLRRPLAGGFDVLIDRGLFPRNILDVYARKPLARAPGGAARDDAGQIPTRSAVAP